MRILWPNIIAAALVTLAGVVLVKHSRPISAFIETMGHIGPGYSSDEQTLGLIAFAIVCISIVAVVKILSQNNRK
jgi:hypothetical protein